MTSSQARPSAPQQSPPDHGTPHRHTVYSPTSINTTDTTDATDAVNNINLDAILNLEATSHAEGVATTHADSALAGHHHGRHLGWTTGAALSAELSFYHGAAIAILTLSDTHGEQRMPTKAVATARRLAALCERVALHRVGNDANVDMEAHADEVRALFRAAVTQAGLIVRYGRVPSRMADLSF